MGKADMTKERPRHLYARDDDHKALKIEAAQNDAEIGEVTDAMIRAWYERSEKNRRERIAAIRVERGKED